jgi:hypothetical protein
MVKEVNPSKIDYFYTCTMRHLIGISSIAKPGMPFKTSHIGVPIFGDLNLVLF